MNYIGVTVLYAPFACPVFLIQSIMWTVTCPVCCNGVTTAWSQSCWCISCPLEGQDTLGDRSDPSVTKDRQRDQSLWNIMLRVPNSIEFIALIFCKRVQELFFIIHIPRSIFLIYRCQLKLTEQMVWKKNYKHTHTVIINTKTDWKIKCGNKNMVVL